MNVLIATDAVVVESRMRKDMGNIDELCNSIREFGLLQPILLRYDVNAARIRLVAGGRRLAALKRLGVATLEHAKHFVWVEDSKGDDEVLKLRFAAMELEENIKRKDLSWAEQLAAKQRLFELMQQIKGLPVTGRPSGLTDKVGFGINKLASMLGESVGATSQDLQVARALVQFPQLAAAPTKGAAFTQLKILAAVAGMTPSKTTVAERSWELHECDFGFNKLADESVDLIWTDLPYGANVDKMSAHASLSDLAQFDDDPRNVAITLVLIARESFRVLKPNRYAVFCFGFIFYTLLAEELAKAGFNVNPVPFIWAKNTKSGENPTTRYCNSYEPLLVAMKGSPVFIRPGHGNLLEIPVEQGKLQAVQKPVELVEFFIKDMVSNGATIVDWCVGTGTTGVAAHRCGCRSILYEKDPTMAALARARLEAL